MSDHPKHAPDPPTEHRFDTARQAIPASSSARRRPVDGGVFGRRAILAAVFLSAFVVVVHEWGRGAPDLSSPPTPSPVTVQPTTPPPATATWTPQATPTLELRSEWVVMELPTATATPAAVPPPSPTRRPWRPTATPTVSSCLHFSWSAGQSMAAWGQILVEIRVVNDCRRILEPHELWFSVSGWRDGAEVHHSEGHGFNELRPNGRDEVIIGLPGSLDWYHELRVELIEQPAP